MSNDPTQQPQPGAPNDPDLPQRQRPDEVPDFGDDDPDDGVDDEDSNAVQ